MGIQIEDGLGTGQLVGVSPTGNRQNVSSRSDERIYYISRDNGDSYTVCSIDTPSGAGEYNLYFKNTSTTKKFYVKEITIASIGAASFKISKVSGTATGTTITPVNLNFNSGSTASATVFGNGAVGGLSEDAVIETAILPANTTEHIDFHDALILGQSDAIAIETDTWSSGAVHMSVIGFFDVE